MCFNSTGVVFYIYNNKYKIKNLIYCISMDVGYIVLGVFISGYFMNQNGKTPRYSTPREPQIRVPEVPEREHARFSAQPQGWRPEPEPNVKHVQTVNFDNNTTLDYQTGGGDPFDRKTEQKPLFAPTPNVIQNLNQDMQSIDNARHIYQVSNNLRNETPVPAQQVGPGLNVDSSVASSGGFHPTLRIVPTNAEANKLNQLEGRVIPGKAENAKRSSNPGIIKQNCNFRYYTKSNESFLPTKAAETRMMVRSDYDASLKEGSKANHEQYFGGAVMYNDTKVADNRSGDDNIRETQRGQDACMVGIASGYTKPQNTTGYTGYQTDREELGQYPVGVANAGSRGPIQSNMNSNTIRGLSSQRDFADFAANARGPDKTYPTITQYKNDPTNRENASIIGQVSGLSAPGHTVEESGIQVKTTGREAMHEGYMGVASSEYKAGMSYADLVNAEGYSLRSVTDENRVAGPQKINSINPDPKQQMNDHFLKPELNYTREGAVVPHNPLYGTIAKPIEAPNKVEFVNDRFDPNLIQSQMQTNPYRSEHGAKVSEPSFDTTDTCNSAPIY